MAHPPQPAGIAQARRLAEVKGSDGDLSAEQRVELEARLEQLRKKLEDLARDRLRWPHGSPESLREQSEALEIEADGIRRQLGMQPALGRSSRSTWTGWICLCLAVGVIVIGVWQFAT